MHKSMLGGKNIIIYFHLFSLIDSWVSNNEDQVRFLSAFSFH